MSLEQAQARVKNAKQAVRLATESLEHAEAALEFELEKSGTVFGFPLEIVTRDGYQNVRVPLVPNESGGDAVIDTDELHRRIQLAYAQMAL